METNSNINESEQTFGEFLKKFTFVIPDYQRAYSWEDKQLIPFLKDILEHCDETVEQSDNTKYYLGHYILENSENENIYEIVDGQQRISTVYLFLLVCGFIKKQNYIVEIKFTPVSYDIAGLEEIKLILSERNSVDEKLNDLLQKDSNTSSLKRMVKAVILFKNAFQDSGKVKLNELKINEYVQIINNAYSSVAVFRDKSVASQIFELHNTRGVKLTETEKVKALLMKNIYLNSNEADKDIKYIQSAFASVFEFEEKASATWLRGEMPLDTILMFHLRAVDDGKKVAHFSLPYSIEGEGGSFEYVKGSLSKKNSQEIVEYSKNLAKEFKITMRIFTEDIPLSDKQNHLIGDILLLARTRSTIFLLRAFRLEGEFDNKLIKRWENFILCYEIINWNGFFYGKRHRGEFDSIFASLNPLKGFNECNALLTKFYNGDWFASEWINLGENTKKLFEEGKNKLYSGTYGWNIVGYILYKYEINNNGPYEIIRANIFKGNSVSIDHIVAQGLKWESLGFNDYDKLLETDTGKQEAKGLWDKILLVINGIGNLALSTSSSNSSDSNKLPLAHTKTFGNAGLVNTCKQVSSWNNPEDFANKINERSEDIIKFIAEKIINRGELWEEVF